MKEKPDNRKIRTTGVLELTWKDKMKVHVSGWMKI
jgi:hypothetical protein